MKNIAKNIRAKKFDTRQNGIKFVFFVLFLVFMTVFLAQHIADIFFGDNSIEVYSALKQKESYLQNEIIRLQADNARLQKEYFELKNLEPKE
ncbi:MAG: septum formation initiator [Arcobacteraceae bacterium]